MLPASRLINQTVVAKTAANMELVLCFARMRTRVSAAHCFVLQTTSQTRLVHFARIREHMFCCSLHNTKGNEDRQGSMTCLELPDSLCVDVWPSLKSIAWKLPPNVFVNPSILSTQLLYVLMFSKALMTLNDFYYLMPFSLEPECLKTYIFTSLPHLIFPEYKTSTEDRLKSTWGSLTITEFTTTSMG